MTNNPPDDAVPITKFMLETAENFQVAHAIHEHYDAARAELLDSFFERLAEELSTTHPQWEYDWTEFFTGEFGQFKTCKKAWDWRYVVAIEAQKHGNRMAYGVWRNEDRISQAPRDATLHGLVSKKLPHVRKSRRWFEAEIYLTSPAPDWRLPEVLWRMHKEPEFLKEIASLMREMMDLTEKRVDELVTKLR